MKGQTSVEFLMAAAVSLLFFTVTLYFYFEGQNDLAEMSKAAEARRICSEIAAQIAAVSTSGGNASAQLMMPRQATIENYTVNIRGSAGAIAVNYENRGAGCLVGHRGIVNATGNSDFILPENATITNVDGGVVVG